jgi:DNA polymerase III sliding clamp (beta) subunit (PCNA family)
MKIKTEILLNGLNAISGTVAKKAYIQATTHVCFEMNNGLSLKSCDLENMTIHTISASDYIAKKDVSFTVPYAELTSFLSKYKDEQIELDYNEDAQCVRFLSANGKYHFELPCLKADDFPNLITGSGISANALQKLIDKDLRKELFNSGDVKEEIYSFCNSVFELSAEKAKSLIKILCTYCIDDDLKPALSGIGITPFTQCIFVESTDGTRLFSTKLVDNVLYINEKRTGSIIQKKAMEAIAKSASDKKVQSITFYCLDKNCLILIGDNTVIVSRLIDAKFPETANVKTLYYKELSFVVSRDELINAIEFIMPVSKKVNTNLLEIVMNEESITLKSNDLDNKTSAEISVNVSYVNKYDAMRTGVNAKLLHEICKAFESEFITFTFDGDQKLASAGNGSGNSKAIQIRHDNSDDLALVMPLMLYNY